MTAAEYRTYDLACDSGTGCANRFGGRQGESRAAVRRRAAREGWTRIEHPAGRRADDDYCPEHMSAASLPARVAHVTFALMEALSTASIYATEIEGTGKPAGVQAAEVNAFDPEARTEQVTLTALRQAVRFGLAWNTYGHGMKWAEVEWFAGTEAWRMHSALEGRYLREISR